MNNAMHGSVFAIVPLHRKVGQEPTTKLAREGSMLQRTQIDDHCTRAQFSNQISLQVAVDSTWQTNVST